MSRVSDSIVSFVDGRVRLRHPALKKPDLADMAVSVVKSVEGVQQVSVNPVTGSMLLFYDTHLLSRDSLMELAGQCEAFFPEENRTQTRRHLLTGRRVNGIVNRTLALSLLCSLFSAAAGLETLHRTAGMICAAAALQHMAAHRKALR